MAKFNGDRNRSKTHCKWGHEFTPENTWRNKDGHRWCKACLKRRSDERQERLRA